MPSKSGRLPVLFFYWISFIANFCHYGEALKETLRIGAVFQESSSDVEDTFKFAVESVNANPRLLPNYNIEYSINKSSVVGAYDSWQKVCYLMKQNISTLIGPMTSTAVKASHPMCLGLTLPMITPTATDPRLVDPANYRYLLRIFPPDSKQSKALVDFMKYLRWDTVAILTDNTDYGINGFVDFQTMAAENAWQVLSVQQFVATKNASLANAVPQLKSIKGTGARVIFLNCGPEHAVQIFQQAEREGMMQKGWAWIVTDGVSGFNHLPGLLNERPYLQGILGVRPTSFNGSLYDGFRDSWTQQKGNTSQPPTSTVAFAAYDAVLVYANAMHQMLEVDGKSLVTKPLSCQQMPAEPWDQGSQVLDYLKQVKADGTMSYLEFNENGGPVHVSYDYVRLSEDGWQTHGHWVEGRGIEINTTGLESFAGESVWDLKDYGGDLLNKSLKVAVVVEPPFAFKKDANESCDGNDCFSGYVIDLLERLASELQFTYELYSVPDGMYGRQDERGQWSGLMAELVDLDGLGRTRADLGIGAFTISYERQKAITFTKPYRDHQLGILMGTLSSQTFNPWSFLTPLSNQVWALTIGTAFVVGAVITLLDKLSPYGHHGKKGQVDNELEHEAMDTNDDGTVDYWEMKDWRAEKHTMSFHNAMLWALASLFEQGAERHPKSWSARIAAAAWWIGALIITQSYTANLAAFLTIKSQTTQIQSVEDLARQVEPGVKYGTVRDSHAYSFFENSIRNPYNDMFVRMDEWGTAFNTTEEAIQHTYSTNGSFALLYDSPTLEYWKGQAEDCGLRLLDNGFANFGFGLGLPKGSIYVEELTLKIYTLREAGFMDSLDDTWIAKTAQCLESGSNQPSIDEETNVQIGMPSLWGAFWVVFVSIGISFVVMIIEWHVSALCSINTADKTKPQTCCQALSHRYRILKRDILENWFPINFHKADIKRQESVIRPLPPSMQLRLLKAAATAAVISSKATSKRLSGRNETGKSS